MIVMEPGQTPRHGRVKSSGATRAAIGKVARIYRPLATVPADGRHGRHSRNDGESFTPLKFEWNNTWIATLALLGLVVLVIGFGLTSWLVREARRQPQSAASSRAFAAEAAQQWASEPPTERAALALVKQALAVRDAAGVAQFFHHRQASPDAVIRYLMQLEAAQGGDRKLKWLGNMDTAGRRVEGVMVTGTEDGDNCQRLILITEQSAGIWKVDFEALARPIDPPWEQLIDGSVTEVQAYVLLERDYYAYYNGPFADEAQWACFCLVLPDHEGDMFGYCRRDSAQHEAIERILRVDGDPLQVPGTARAVVVVRKREGADQRQFEIVRVLAGDWLLTDAAFDHQDG